MLFGPYKNQGWKMKKHFFLSTMIILFAFILYITGIKWGLPDASISMFLPQQIEVSDEYVKSSWQISKDRQHEKLPRSIFNPIRSFHPDEQIILKSIAAMNVEKFDFNPHYFEYPSAQIYLVAITLKVLSISGIINLTSDISYYYESPEEMAKIYLAGRILTVIIATLGLIVFLSIGKVLCGKNGSLFALAAFAFSPLYVINSHYMTVDIPAVFWMIVSFYFAVFFLQKRKIYLSFLSALFAGIASGTKYPVGIIIFILPFVYRNVFNDSFSRFLRMTIVSFLIFFAGFFITTPYSLVSFHEFKRDIFYQAGARGIGAGVFSNLLSFPYELLSSLWVGIFLMVVFFIPGIFVQARRRNLSDRLILTCIVLSMAPLMITGGFKYTRYYLPLLPFLCLSAGSLFDDFLKIKYKYIRYCAILLSLFLLIGPSIKSSAYSSLMTRKDIRLIAAEYVDDNIPQHTRIVFTKDPWIFEVPPVNPLKYSIYVIPEEDLEMVPSGSYLIIGELQYFLTSGNRNREMAQKIELIPKKGFILEKVFTVYAHFGPIYFDEKWTIHDMLYTHPRILLFQKS